MADKKETKPKLNKVQLGPSERAQIGTMKEKLLIVIRLRGEINITKKITDTLEMLHLHKKHRAVIIPGTKSFMGMLSKVSPYCTFGEIDEATLAELLTKRGRLVGDKPLTDAFLNKSKKGLNTKNFASMLMERTASMKDIEGLKQFFKLQPPRGGFERGGIKKPYSMHGALGYRGDTINKLLKKMI